jgi:hypothetical protein
VTTEHQDVLKTLETMIEKLEHMSVQQKAVDPGRQETVDDLLSEAQTAIDAIVRWQRKREDEAQLKTVIEAINKNTETFLKAIDKNTKATNQLLVISEARLNQIESELTDSDDNLPEVDPAVLAEAAFLKAQLAGIEGNEKPGPLFKDAQVVTIPSGLEVLSTAVNTAGTYSVYATSP